MRTYIYFAAYTFSSLRGPGSGRTELRMPQPITQFEHIEQAEAAINRNGKAVELKSVMTNFILLRIEDEHGNVVSE